MNRTSTLLLLFSIGCNTETVEQYSAGISIEHAKEYRTTKQDFGSFYLHTWFHDTLYRHSGHEFQIEPVDSALEIKAFAQGAQLIESSENKYHFILDPTDSIVTLTLVVNGQDTINKVFISPYLPLQTLAKETSEDSVILSLYQEDTRLQKLLPMDTRYGFKSAEGLYETMAVPSDDLDVNNIEAIRVNYRNRTYPVAIKK